MSDISSVLNSKYNIVDEEFRNQCQQKLDEDGVLVLPSFITEDAIQAIKDDGVAKHHLAYYTNTTHNIYLTPSVSDYSEDHIRNRKVVSSKGCITNDQIASDSPLRTLYNNDDFRSFLATILKENKLYNYADPLSSINLHYAEAGKELGWHFDNSSFAITLLIQKPEAGANFQYVRDVRNADAGDMGFEISEKIVNGEVEVQEIEADEGTLVMFRGRNSIHCVKPTEGDVTRMMVVLAYNNQPNISLSESARTTFYGRLE